MVLSSKQMTKSNVTDVENNHIPLHSVQQQRVSATSVTKWHIGVNLVKLRKTMTRNLI